MANELLDRRACNRATLARQLLLERQSMPLVAAVEHLVGLQAQLPLNPYLALWSRLDGFDPVALGKLITERHLVRIVVMRSTIHLVSADDCLVLRPFAQPVIDRELRGRRDVAPALEQVDLEPVLAFARARMDDEPLAPTALRRALADEFPNDDPAALAAACRNHLPLVQVPPRGVWGQGAGVKSTTADSFLGRPLARRAPVEEIAFRYFAAFGPATVADLASWSGLTGMREVVERIRPRLQTFRDEQGRELFDPPEGPRPHSDTPAPPRFLPEYDNALLSHADRARFITDEDRKRLSAGARVVRGTVMHDGLVIGTWRTVDDRDTGRVTLVVDHLGGLPRAATRAISDEGHAMLAFHASEASAHEVRLSPLP